MGRERDSGVSVIVPARNVAAVVPAQLEALADQTYTGPMEIIIADNGSTDGTRAIIEAWSKRDPRVRLIDASDGRGANVARNAGAHSATGQLLLFCDADDVVHPDWVAAMAAAAAAGEVLGGRLDDEPLNDAKVRSWRQVGTQDGLPIFAGFLPFAMTANMAVHRSVFHDLGGFDESYPHGCDDVDFCWRAQLEGFRLSYVPDAIVFYRLRTRLRSLARQSYDYGRWTPALYRRFREHGMPRSGARQGLSAWRALFRSAPRMWRHRAGRGIWAAMAARRAGRLVGSARERTLYL